jgi:hypothetical protein
MVNLGKLRRVAPRTVWFDEARAFTPWLADNLSTLGEALGLELELTGREAGVGTFSLDLLAKDLGSGGTVVIENQFGSTNHDHLGKILTYASGFDAKVVIWVAETFRDEHRQALDWLNQHTDQETQFFGVLVEVLQIDDSAPALNFKPVVFPNEWQKERRKAADEQVSPRAESYREFFQTLIDELRQRHKFTNARVGQPQNWYSFTSGVSGFTYGCSFGLNSRVRVELYIDRGDGSENEEALNWLLSQRLEIEREFGEALEWEPLEDRRACRVAVYRAGSIDHAESLADIRAWAVARLLQMRKVMGARIARYQSPGTSPGLEG